MPDRYRIAGALSSPMRPCVGAAVDAAVCVRAGAGDLLGSGICCDAAVLLLLRRLPLAVSVAPRARLAARIPRSTERHGTGRVERHIHYIWITFLCRPICEHQNVRRAHDTCEITSFLHTKAGSA